MRYKLNPHHCILQTIGLILMAKLPMMAVSCTNDSETMYQVSTLESLLDGGYDGHITVSELLKHGDIGVGTFDRIDGEMIVVDGSVYQARHDGSVNVADPNLTVPFANVTHFDRDITFTLSDIRSMEDLTSKLTEAVRGHGLNKIYVARMDVSRCESIYVRSELPQQHPYRPLAEVLQTDQREFRYENIGGTIVALFMPEFFDRQNATGWHLHFISDDKTKGGHMFNVEIKGSVTVNVDITPCYNLYMP